MIFKNLIEKIPEKKRIRKVTNVHYVYEIISRKNRKQKKDKVVCVGVAIDKTTMHPNEKYYDLHKNLIIKKPLLEQKEFDNQVHIGANLLTRTIANQEGLTNILNEVFGSKTELLFSLAEYYLINRDSAAQLYKYYLFDHFTQMNYIPSESQISKLFNNFIDHELISNFLTKWMNYRIACKSFSSKIDIDFDSTNRNVSSDSLLQAEYGKAKVNEGLPQINTAYFLDRESGLPLFFDVYYGSIIDVAHCNIAMNKIKTINKNIKGNFVLDRGYFSRSNIEYITNNNYSFMCMGKDTNVFDKLIKDNPVSKISASQNYVYKTIYGIKFYSKAFSDSSKKYYIYLFHNEADTAFEIAKLHEEINYCCKFLVGKKDIKGNISNTYGKRINLEIDEDGIISKASPNFDYLETYRKRQGYFWIISNENDSLENVLKSYRYRDAIEKEIKYSKSLCDLDKTFASSDNAYEAKILLGFICAILRSVIVQKCSSYFLQYSGETSQTVIKELDKIKTEEINGQYILRYSLTSRQKQILSLFGIDLRSVYNMIENINFTRKLTSKN